MHGVACTTRCCKRLDKRCRRIIMVLFSVMVVSSSLRPVVPAGGVVSGGSIPQPAGQEARFPLCLSAALLFLLIYSLLTMMRRFFIKGLLFLPHHNKKR